MQICIILITCMFIHSYTFVKVYNTNHNHLSLKQVYDFYATCLFNFTHPYVCIAQWIAPVYLFTVPTSSDRYEQTEDGERSFLL